MFSGIKEKIQKKLDVPDKEFEKVGRNTVTSYVRPPDTITSYLFQANQKNVSEHIETMRDMGVDCPHEWPPVYSATRLADPLYSRITFMWLQQHLPFTTF